MWPFVTFVEHAKFETLLDMSIVSFTKQFGHLALFEL